MKLPKQTQGSGTRPDGSTKQVYKCMKSKKSTSTPNSMHKPTNKVR